MRILLDEKKKYYKVNLHCHTTCSDGTLTPEEIKAEYKKRGYSAVAFTDHEHVIDQSHLCDDDFIAINGCELAIKENPGSSTLTNRHMKATHLCLYAKEQNDPITPCYNSAYDHFVTPSSEGRFRHEGEYDRTFSAEGISEIISIAHEKGYLVCYNHPGWSLEDATDYFGYLDADFVEIFNTGSVVQGFYDDEAAYAEMLRRRADIYCIAADDNHNRLPLDSPNSDSFGGFVMINSDELSYKSLMSALESGSFYASCGPLIHSLVEDNGKITVKCDPCRKISLLTNSRYSRAAYGEAGALITEATFDLPESKPGFRIRIEDCNGGRAYTRFYKIFCT